MEPGNVRLQYSKSIILNVDICRNKGNKAKGRLYNLFRNKDKKIMNYVTNTITMVNLIIC